MLIKNKVQQNFGCMKTLRKIDLHNWEMMAGKYNYHRRHKQASNTCTGTREISLEHRAQHNASNQHTFKISTTWSTTAQVKKTITKLMQQHKTCKTVLFQWNSTSFYDTQNQRLQILRNMATDFQTTFIQKLVKISYFSPKMFKNHDI